MYLPTHFSEHKKEVLHTLITGNPFGALVTHGPAGLDVNHLPFELEPNTGALGVLSAHASKNNPLLNEVKHLDEVLVVFQAGNAYISPTWLPSKKDTERQVPTWNYKVVHAKGRIKLIHDEAHVRKLVAKLTKRHEASMERPWKISDAPKGYISELLERIFLIEIEITDLVGKFKLNQDDGAKDMVGAGTALKELGEHNIGDAMLEAAKNL